MKTTRIIAFALLLPMKKALNNIGSKGLEMHRIAILTVLLAANGACAADTTHVPQINETKEQRNDRMAWFRDAKFGMFIHWGPCSVGQKEIGWGREGNRPWDINQHGPRTDDPVYDNYFKQFNPTKYDADQWVMFAKESGMKYMVLISKHHDGFSQFDSKQTDYDIMAGPYKKDIVGALADACHKHGMRLGLYYSTRDWYHPDYLVGDNKKYDLFYREQIRELLSNYGRVDIMWFDHVGGRDWGNWEFDELFSMMYHLQPKLIVNNRAARFCRLHPSEETEDATRQPVLKVTLQPDARPKGIAADLLLALGDPAWSSGTVQTLTNRAVRLLRHCGVQLIVMDEFHHLFDADRAKVMTKASQWLKVLIVNTGIPVVVCGMPEAEYVLRAEHSERRFKERLTLRCFTWRTAKGRREFCGMLKKLDETLPLAKTSGLADAETAGRLYLACRGIPDYLMTLLRGAVAEAIERNSQSVELADLARVFEQKLAQQRVLAEQANPFIGKLDHGTLDRVQAADQGRAAGVGLTPKAAKTRNRPAKASDFLGGHQ